jgi:Winged helix domain, variant/ATPase family associated with various cellular activities (AAA)
VRAVEREVTVPLDASMVHVLGRLDVVRLRVAAVVAARRAVDAAPDDPFLGLYLSDDRIDDILRNDRVWVDAAVAGDQLEAVEARADIAAADGAELRLRALAERFGLDELDVEILLTAMAPDVDDRFERYYGYLNDDVTRRRVSVGLALGLAGVHAAEAVGRARFEAGGALTAGGLVEIEDPDRPFLTRAVRVPDRVTAHLLGGDEPDAALGFVIRTIVPTAEPPYGPLVRALRRPAPLVYVHDRVAVAAEPVVDAAAAVGLPLVVIDLDRLEPNVDAERLVLAAVREVRLRGGLLVAGPIDQLAETNLAAVQKMTAAPVGLVLIGHRGWDPAFALRPPVVIDAPALTAPARARIWTSVLDGNTVGGFDPAALTGHYRLAVGQIRRAASAALLAAGLDERAVDESDVRLGARQQNAARLERLARRIDPAVSWDDLVLPPLVLAGLHNLAQRVRHRERVLGEWRMRPGGGRGVGITALFAGDSGTGKTMSAEVIATDLGLDLYVVNLATVVDKYIGETEKNLDRIFAEADNVNGVLLFDEADALFGQRSEVRDSHDRYANIEVAYLLQRMETFDGLAILSTNLRSNIDDAFTRRLDVIVDFPMPDPDLRRRLWEQCLSGLPAVDELDLGYCAKAFELSGGNIRSIAVTIAYEAAAGDRPAQMADVVRAIGQEYRKLGRLTLEAEFGEYFPLLRPA